MKKIGVLLAVLILAVPIGLPVVNGIILEKTLNEAIDNANRIYTDTGLDMHFEITEYNRGLFDTRAELRIYFGSLAAVYGIKEMILVEKAKHGFLSISSETSLEKNLWYSDWVRTRLNGKDPLKIQTEYSATGPMISTITLAGFVMETEKTPLKIGAGEFEITVDKAFTSVSTTGRWEGLSENETNKMGPVTFEAAHSKITNLIWQGNGSMAMEEFAAGENGVLLDLSELSCSYHLTADSDQKKMSMGMEMTAGGVEFNRQPLSQWAFEWGLDNVDIQAYEALTKTYYGVMNTHLAQIRPDLPPEEAVAVMQKAMSRNAPQFITGLEKLLKKDLEIRVSRMDMTLPQGKIKGSLALGLKQDVSMTQFLLLAVQPSLALDMFSFQSDLSLPRVLGGGRQDLTVPIFPGMKTGFFIEAGEKLTHRAEIRENKLYLNGQEVILDF